MIPVAGCSVVRLVAIAIIISTGSLTLASTCTRFIVHLIRLADPRCFRIELAIVTEVHRRKRAPAIVAGNVVHYDIRHATCVLRIQFADQFAQLRFATPVAVQVAVLLGDIARAAA